MPNSHDLTRDSLFRQQLPAFQSVWPAGGWSWDNRFSCLASTIPQDVSEEGWTAAKRLFPNIWDERKIVAAPPLVTKIATATGGVRRGQFLLSSDDADGLLLYGLWWPWGEEGSNISMRIGLTGNPSPSETSSFRAIFKASDD